MRKVSDFENLPQLSGITRKRRSPSHRKPTSNADGVSSMATLKMVEKLGRNDLCPCNSGRRFQGLLHESRRL